MQLFFNTEMTGII